MKLYTCNACWFECRNKKWMCKGCDVKFQEYDWEYCWCRWRHLFWWSAFKSYKCISCWEMQMHSNTNTPIICWECAKSQQCIYCWRRRADDIFRIRKNRYMNFHNSIMNKEHIDSFCFCFENVEKIPEEYMQETKNMVDKVSLPL